MLHDIKRGGMKVRNQERLKAGREIKRHNQNMSVAFRSETVHECKHKVLMRFLL